MPDVAVECALLARGEPRVLNRSLWLSQLLFLLPQMLLCRATARLCCRCLRLRLGAPRGAAATVSAPSPRLELLPMPRRWSLPRRSTRTGRGTPPGPTRAATASGAFCAASRLARMGTGSRRCAPPVATAPLRASACSSSRASLRPWRISAVGFCHQTGRTKLCGRLSGCSASRVLLVMCRLWKLCTGASSGVPAPKYALLSILHARHRLGITRLLVLAPAGAAALSSPHFGHCSVRACVMRAAAMEAALSRVRCKGRTLWRSEATRRRRWRRGRLTRRTAT